jgi:phospholipid-binding lipoprotein MlaA
MFKEGLQAATLALSLVLAGCAHSPVNDPSDPLEGFNRGVFAFNTGLDDYLLRPVTKGYVYVTPEVAQTGVSNFFSNLTYPTVIVNDALQGKVVQHFSDVGRFLFNTIVGLGGLVDAASMIGLNKHDEDFGQTLGYWGIGNGAFLMLPLLGPSTNRDLVGRIGNAATNPLTYVDFDISAPLTAGGVVDTRAQLLGTDRVVEQQLDRYIFVRNAYLQRRESLVYDGHPPKERLDFQE